MPLNNLKPFRKKDELAKRRTENEHPYFALQHQMNRMFDDFFRGFDIEPFGRFSTESVFMPQMNISEDDKEIVISTELPGIDEKELDISITKDALTISGEKKTETEDKDKNYHRVERSYGSFSRSIVLPDGVDKDKAEAELKKGVLTIKIPKSAEAQPTRKKLEVKSE
ncbi:MAG: Hsp20/alpha crystallin family protein [Sedimentisphaerales bacterium]|nr:Hsp20/alpha crystallin family protein [Sedimentisphaerales bacterium]